jgi:hypothetical protein
MDIANIVSRFGHWSWRKALPWLLEMFFEGLS